MVLITIWIPKIMTLVMATFFFPPIFGILASIVIVFAIMVLGISTACVLAVFYLCEDSGWWRPFLWIAFGVFFGSLIAFFVRT